ncbi:hypothetical protein COY28_03740 [Candidatus Woesearchaeota archaeon CG_4_10_14_0_2_um_filter_57_5]|nr:MAG: hypothetical protein AUJ68_01185 [Candidatus Woesearchaeota archaeon CG1_02_57_44]PIN68328.1 MAG: hypothetical protein COV94_05245 [Candidatus Woesearchaeota archaeon CG11_big_fil_rev_8_21_14_0_20_57_5]PIZ53212.1 MAG: hypothetical protein COY28_03740 [Candidatus Woesearchaeota archaeon CG_4_10_14_0_2_um_filter_57_5]
MSESTPEKAVVVKPAAAKKAAAKPVVAAAKPAAAVAKPASVTASAPASKSKATSVPATQSARDTRSGKKRLPTKALVGKTICIVRVRGQTGVKPAARSAMTGLGIERRHSYAVIEATAQTMGLLMRIKDFCTFGTITEETKQSLKPLQSPRGGWKSCKRAWPKGALGIRQDMDALIARMLP